MAKSDDNLIDYLSKCDSVEIKTLLGMLKSKLSPASKKLAEQYKYYRIPEANTQERRLLAIQIGNLIGWYGSNTIAYVYRKLNSKPTGCHYHKILRDVAKTLNRGLKKKKRIELPKIETVEKWEELICSILLISALADKSKKDIIEMFEEDDDIDKDVVAAAAQKFGPGAAIGPSLSVLVKVLGKKTVKSLIEKIIIQLTAKIVGKEAAMQMAKRLLIKVPQKVFLKMGHLIGWIILIVDVVGFASSPARRICVPAVAMISALRTRERLTNTEA